MKIRQLIGLLIMIILFTLLGAVSKDLTTYWADWFISWGVVFGVIIAVIVGMFLLLDRDPQGEIL